MIEDRERSIRERAYAIWQHQGCPPGHSVDHWLQAEAEFTNDDALGIRHDGEIEPPVPSGPQDPEC